MRVALVILFCLLTQPALAANETYVPTTWLNLAKVMWHFDAVDSTNTAAIDTMLRISECQIVQKYAKNDFDWNDIRAGMRKTIAANKAGWPTTVKFTQQIDLLPYNFQTYAFPIAPNSDWNNVTRLQIAANDIRQQNICSQDIQTADLQLLPSAASVKLDQPFTLNMVGVLKEVAELYVQQYPQIGSTRRAYVTFYVTLDNLISVRDNSENPYQPYLAEFKGRIDRFEVHADMDGKKPLFMPGIPPRHSGY